VPETFPETPETPAAALAKTTLTDRELLIHALQHLEAMYEQVAETHEAIIRIDGELAVFKPLLARLAPGGKPDFLAVFQARREHRRGN
jgi:hypothetical protein